MRKFLWLIARFLMLPAGFVVLFAFLDPFQIVHTPPATRIRPINASDDYFAVQRYKANKAQGRSYDTFIFGNSKVLAFLPEDVCQGEDCNYYNFGAPGESLLNIRKKLDLIAAQGDKPRKVILLLDHQILANERNTHPFFQGPVYIHHPQTSTIGWADFYWNHLGFYFKDFFWLKHLDYSLFGTWRPYMAGVISEPTEQETSYDPVTNVVERVSMEAHIQANPESYAQQHQAQFDAFNPTLQWPERLSQEQQTELNTLSEQLADTEVHIIFGPLWKVSNPPNALLKAFEGAFGENNVYDFTQMDEVVNNPRFWYEPNHYRPLVGRKILSQIRAATIQNP